MKKYTFLLILAALAVSLATGAAWANRMHGGAVTIKLSALPGTGSGASGAATFSTSKDGSSVHYVLKVKNLVDGTMAHVHGVTDDGNPAAVVTWLYPVNGSAPSLKEGKFSGTLAEGDITAEKLGGSLKGGTLKDLVGNLVSGKAGVAVHTKKNAGGELWGVNKAKKEMKSESGSMGY